MRIRVNKRYQCLIELADFARLTFVQTDFRVSREGSFRHASDPSSDQPSWLVPTGPPVKVKLGRTVWRWPDPIDEADRGAILKAFAQRLRHRFPPAHEGAMATIELSAGSYDFDNVAYAFAAGGWAALVLDEIAKLNRDIAKSPDFQGGNQILMHPHGLWISLKIQELNRIIGVKGEEYSVSDSYSGFRQILITESEINGRREWIVAPAVDFFHDRLLPTLYGCEVSRIRRCPICSRPFVARRTDAGACSGHCLGAYRQREMRRLRKERGKDYELNRGRNYWKKPWPKPGEKQ